MEILFGILEGLLWLLDVEVLSADVYSWFKGKENRLERKEARKAGLDLPPRDRWNRRVITLTIFVGIITSILLIWKW